jgi:hypothetical protein
MSHQFHKHYTREEANALLPQVRVWLARIGQLREELQTADKRLGSLMKKGNDLGGTLVNDWVRKLAATKDLLDEFNSRQIMIKDMERGLIDFPAIIGGREVFLCWEQDEETVEFWHDLDSGYTGRERLE